MYDAIYPQNLPAGGDAYLGYADGRWPDYAAIAASHNVPVFALTVFGTDGVGVGVDVEPGDATVQQAAQYIKDTIAAGKVDRPIGYTMESWAVDLVNAVTALGVDRTHWRLLTAHVGQGKHICGPTTCGCPVQADGTQWNWVNGIYDESLVDDHFLGAAPHPGPTPVPASAMEDEVYLFEINGGTYVSNLINFRWVEDQWDLNAIKTANPAVKDLGVVNGFKGFGIPADAVTAKLAGLPDPYAELVAASAAATAELLAAVKAISIPAVNDAAIAAAVRAEFASSPLK